MAGKLAPLALLPFASGCITVQHRHYLIDFDRLAGPLTDSGLTGWLLDVASCSGLLGGAVAWIVARRGRRSPETKPRLALTAMARADGFAAFRNRASADWRSACDVAAPAAEQGPRRSKPDRGHF